MTDIPGQRFSIHQPMVSASAEAERRTYKLLQGKSNRRWLVALQPNEGDNVYVEGGPNSDGFGGRTITFPLDDGTEVKLRGPWESNTTALFDDTGYDARNKHWTFGLVALERECDWKKGDLYKSILHKDGDWTIGSFDRIERLAKNFANELGRTVYYAKVSKGGGAAGSMRPEEVAA